VKFYLDENFPPDLLATIRLIYDDHEFSSWEDEGLSGATDVELFATLPDRGFDALLTRDRRQLENTDERVALIASGLGWIGLKENKLKGREKLAVTAASLLVGLVHVIGAMAEGERVFQIYNVPHTRTQRMKVISLRP
jgi:hypothetical protein